MQQSRKFYTLSSSTAEYAQSYKNSLRIVFSKQIFSVLLKYVHSMQDVIQNHIFPDFDSLSSLSPAVIGREKNLERDSLITVPSK